MEREEQIRLARQLLESGVLSEESANAIKADFPELAESEDERIRKELVKLFEEKLQKCYEWKEGIPNRSVLNWLEKQKEQKPTNSEKPKEWSEEDKKTIEEAIRRIEQLDHYWNRPTDEKLMERLKSLRPQPKAKLTLLDKNIINAAVAFVEQNNHFNVWSGIDKHTVIKALRSLKPHWKPSEEQMYALKDAIETYRVRHNASTSGDNVFKGLESLYSDIKKLH